MKSRVLVGCLSISLLGLLPVSHQASASTETLPRADFPICSVDRMTYCIASVTFIELSGEKPGEWIPSGTNPLPVFSTFEKVSYAGRFSYSGFDVSRGMDGVYVRVGPANEFTDTMIMSVEPAGTGASGRVSRIKDDATGKVASLPADMGVRVSVRLGALVPAITVGVMNNGSVNKSMDGTTPVITLEGTPVSVPIQNSAADCVDETGTAVAKPYQLFALVAFANGRDPYGVPGLSGDMFVTSNGVCKLTTPTWSPESLSFAFTASAPHFAPDGTVNRGFYRASIPATDAGILFGIIDPKTAATALELVFEDSEYGQVSVQKQVGVLAPTKDKKTGAILKDAQIVISFTNFQFSAPKMTIKVKSTKLKSLKTQRKKSLNAWINKNKMNKN